MKTEAEKAASRRYYHRHEGKAAVCECGNLMTKHSRRCKSCHARDNLNAINRGRY